MSLINDLVTQYAATDLASIFAKVGLGGIDPDRYGDLKKVTLAQWLLESARATSNLAVTANNFSGLKWRNEMTGFATPINIKVPSEPELVDFCKFNDVEAFIVGYWKFLTRAPYKGLEAYTNTPENFIGFLSRKGFATDMGYVKKVINLSPEAYKLLATASGISIPDLPKKLQVESFPKEVEFGQVFVVQGSAFPSDRGKTLSIKIDSTFPVDDVVIGENCKWKMNFSLVQAGERRIQISLGAESEEIDIKAVSPVDKDDPEETTNPSGSVKIALSGSVGRGGVNKAEDVKAVKKRLHELGYTWVGDISSASINTGFIQAIQLFQSIIAGHSTVKGDGRVDLARLTHRWLQAANAPIWKTMPDSDSSINFVNYEKEQTSDDHDFGTSWMADTIRSIAKDYHGTSPTSAPFTINDVSRPQGGDTDDHEGHETGLMCDVLLPRTDGKSGGIEW
ncbi:glucosaminidase domain-containing protein [Coleofasciculus sp. E2-BRE-01]|uniref:glucosaminidase domain-containing protein n=1 Tax=Coleofasciculus sp. E2-BRE-01 TaxID=3069524 RepID=UPI0032F6C6D0